jgi:hypothetical protein
MSYEELKAHAEEIKQLAIDQTVNQLIQGSAAGSAHGVSPPISTYQDMAEQQFAHIDKVFDDWVDLPDPGLLQGGLDNISSALSYLSAESYLTDDDAKDYVGGGGTSFNISQIEPTGAFMQGWQSGTSLSYANFASLFGPVTANLSMCAGVLKGASEAEYEIWKRAREDVDDLAHATIDALKNCLDKDPGDVATVLTVLGAVSGIVAVPFTAGGSLAASYTFAAIAAGTSLGGAFVPADEENDGTITGDTPAEIVTSLKDNLTKLNTDITAKEEDVKSALTQTIADYRAALALDPGVSPVKMPRPSVADDPSFGDHD